MGNEMQGTHGGSIMSSDAFPNFENFGNYILLKKLATGGMAEVFLARPASHKGNGRVQVIKRILPHAARDMEFIKMFQEEIRVCMGFNHPHTVQIHDFGDYNRQPYISMEYIEGKNLKDIMVKFTEKGEMIPVPLAISLIAQAASGLSYAHTFVNKVTGEEVRAIHRDISPHNLIVSYEGNLKVIDFGIAKAASSMHEATRAGTIKGKFAYLSPEQINGDPLDVRVDIFALGIVAWELLTLRRPFYRAGDSEMTILTTISNCDYNVKAPSYFNGAIPPELDQIILKCLRRNPEERFASAEELQSALRQLMQTHYPNYSYSENAKLLQQLFAAEIEQERNEIRILNMNVQLSLSNSTMATAPTVVSGDPTLVVPPPASQKAPPKSAIDAEVDQRLRGIEKMMKEKASTRHYMMFAFYIISIVVLKLDESYALFDFLVPQARVTAVAPRAGGGIGAEERVAPQPKVRAPARTLVKAQPRYARPKAEAQQTQQQQQYQYQQQAPQPPRVVKKAPAPRRTVVTQDQE